MATTTDSKKKAPRPRLAAEEQHHLEVTAGAGGVRVAVRTGLEKGKGALRTSVPIAERTAGLMVEAIITGLAERFGLNDEAVVTAVAAVNEALAAMGVAQHPAADTADDAAEACATAPEGGFAVRLPLPTSQPAAPEA